MSRPQHPATNASHSNLTLHEDGQGWRPRSDPITIVRSSDEPSAQQVTLDSDDDDDEMRSHNNDAAVARVNVELDALKLRSQGLIAGSMPVLTSSMTWRDQSQQQPPPAPLLRGIPASRNFRSDLMPPIALTGVETKNVQSYGSLRESQLNGRFLDGPSSFRDVRSVRLAPWKGIADRLVTVPTSHATTIKRPSSSTLSAILQKDTTDSPSHSPAHHKDYSESLSYEASYAPQRFESSPSVLSTSLTGLEILQTARMQQLPLEPLHGTLAEGEGDSQRSPYFSRSLSFPTDPAMLPVAEASVPTIAVYSSNLFDLQQQQSLIEQQSDEYDRDNPDTEGAFELDLDE